MLGLFGTLNLAQRSLQVQRQGVEVAGHNLANVNNPAYTRQRINIATSDSLSSPIGQIGTGADVVAIRQLRNALLDSQMQSELSVRGFLEAQQGALQFGEAALGQSIDRQAGTQGSTDATSSSGQDGISQQLADLFNAFQSLSTSPSSLSERQVVLMKAQSLASQLNQVDGRLSSLRDSLNASIQEQTDSADQLLDQIAKLNDEIFRAENGSPGSANDLRDTRQSKLEELARIVNIQSAESPNGMVDVSISGVTMVSGLKVIDQLQAFDAGGGQWLIQSAGGGTPLTLTSGSIQGNIAARDGAIKDLRDGLNSLATSLISEVNAIHGGGFSLTGTTGANFFTGTGAADIAVNATLLSDPALLQASGVNGAVGDNQAALALARLATTKLTAFGGQTFNEAYEGDVAALGHSLSRLNSDLADQDAVEGMLSRQRDSVSGVSLDEEMTDLMRFQKAFEASAHLISTIAEMLDTVISMKR